MPFDMDLTVDVQEIRPVVVALPRTRSEVMTITPTFLCHIPSVDNHDSLGEFLIAVNRKGEQYHVQEFLFGSLLDIFNRPDDDSMTVLGVDESVAVFFIEADFHTSPHAVDEPTIVADSQPTKHNHLLPKSPWWEGLYSSYS